jgi:hypothetical protein
MAPDAALSQVALVAVGSGLIAQALRGLQRFRHLRIPVDLVAMSGPIWLVMMMAYYPLEALRYGSINKPPMGSIFLLAVLTAAALFGAREGLKVLRSPKARSSEPLKRSALRLPAVKREP